MLLWPAAQECWLPRMTTAQGRTSARVASAASSSAHLQATAQSLTSVGVVIAQASAPPPPPPDDRPDKGDGGSTPPVGNEARLTPDNEIIGVCQTGVKLPLKILIRSFERLAPVPQASSTMLSSLLASAPFTSTIAPRHRGAVTGPASSFPCVASPRSALLPPSTIGTDRRGEAVSPSSLPILFLSLRSPPLSSLFFPSPHASQPPPPSPSPLIGTDRRGEAGEPRGHGELLAWFANYVGKLPDDQLSYVSFANYVGKLPDDQFNLIMDLLFDKDKGIGLNLARYLIGGSVNYTNSPQFLTAAWETRSIPGFRVQPNGPYDWTADGRQRWTMLAALARNVDEGSKNEGCNYSPEQLSTLIRLLTANLQKRKLPTKVAGFDSFVGATLRYTYKFPAAVKAGLFWLNVHGYIPPPPNTTDTRRYMEGVMVGMHRMATGLGKEVWMSEVGPMWVVGNDVGVMLFIARQIVQAVNTMGASAWIFWQAVSGVATNPDAFLKWGLLAVRIYRLNDTEVKPLDLVMSKAGRAPSPREETPERQVSEADTEYLPWADRIDVKEDNGTEETEVKESDDEERDAPVDEEAEAARRPQRAMSEVVAGSSHDTATPRCPGGRGPSSTRARANGATPTGTATTGPVNAAMAAAATQQERQILSLNQRINRLEGRHDAATRPEITRLTAARPRRGREATVDLRGALRRRTDNSGDYANGGSRSSTRSPMVEAALERELRQANTDGVVTEGMDEWADKMEMGNKLLPKLDDGFKGVTEDAITILAYDTSVAVMNFWVTPELAESCVARALLITNPEHIVLLHMVWGVDEKRAGWFTRQMQVWRNTKWEQGRTFVNILHGLPYRVRANPRVRLPVRPNGQDVPRISRKDFLVQFKAGEHFSVTTTIS
ncbi:unnamed protein product [Closterium sp. NIES-64]|nr:unnamed protein product [Closterium sp. NIES-64]